MEFTVYFPLFKMHLIKFLAFKESHSSQEEALHDLYMFTRCYFLMGDSILEAQKSAPKVKLLKLFPERFAFPGILEEISVFRAESARFLSFSILIRHSSYNFSLNPILMQWDAPRSHCNKFFALDSSVRGVWVIEKIIWFKDAKLKVNG